jgi:tRNA(His) 5'-end guanylyltransferase
MKFDELDEKMRVHETVFDYCVLPEMFMVAWIDGRGFRQLTRRCSESKHSFNPTLPDWTACDS